MGNANTLIIFGAPDHEESLARKIAEAAGCQIATATCNGKAVHNGTAYKANGYELDAGNGNLPKKIILFECSEGAIPENWQSAIEIIRCDHHRPGDPGYDKGPDEFWMGSSIGQLCSALFPEIPDSASAGAVALAEMSGALDCDRELIELLYTAAGDHCPVDAYAGRCPGIDPENFADFRLVQKADHLLGPARWEDVDEAIFTFRNEMMAAEAKLEAAPMVNGIADLREYGLIPELPEAAMKTGRKYMAKVDETDRAGNPTGNKKIVLGGCCTPEDVTNFMEWAGQLGNKMGEPYGVPARGFAGVVVTEPYCPTCKGEYLHVSTCCQSCGTGWPEFG